MNTLKLIIIVVFNILAVIEILKETYYFSDYVDSSTYEKYRNLLERFNKDSN